jgi:F-type H+-transporting ATPase subunit epsilon
MNVEIITPDKKVFGGEAVAVTLPGTEGQFQVLNSHSALVSTLGRGNVVVQTGANTTTYSIDGGVVEVLNNKVLVLAEAIL